TVAFPQVTSVFAVPANPVVLLTKGFKNCSATATGAAGVVTITLTDNGGPCTLPISTAAAVQIPGVTAGIAGSPTTGNWTVKTSADITAAAVGVAPIVGSATTPTA